MKSPILYGLLLLAIAPTAIAQATVAPATDGTRSGTVVVAPAQAPAQPTTAPETTAPNGFPQAGTPYFWPYSPPAQGSSQQSVYLYPLQHRTMRRIAVYEGGAVPVGMHIETRRNRGLLTAGPITFGLSYLGSAVTSAICPTACGAGMGWLLLPVVGPFISVGFPQSADRLVALVADGIVQSVGIGLFVLAMLTSNRVLVEDPYSRNTPHSTRPRFAVSPTSDGHSSGLSVSMSYF